jgi:hypothetical protein
MFATQPVCNAARASHALHSDQFLVSIGQLCVFRIGIGIVGQRKIILIFLLDLFVADLSPLNVRS